MDFFFLFQKKLKTTSLLIGGKCFQRSLQPSTAPSIVSPLLRSPFHCILHQHIIIITATTTTLPLFLTCCRRRHHHHHYFCHYHVCIKYQLFFMWVNLIKKLVHFYSLNKIFKKKIKTNKQIILLEDLVKALFTITSQA